MSPDKWSAFDLVARVWVPFLFSSLTEGEIHRDGWLGIADFKPGPGDLAQVCLWNTMFRTSCLDRNIHFTCIIHRYSYNPNLSNNTCGQESDWSYLSEPVVIIMVLDEGNSVLKPLSSKYDVQQLGTGLGTGLGRLTTLWPGVHMHVIYTVYHYSYNRNDNNTICDLNTNGWHYYGRNNHVWSGKQI